MAQPTEQSTIWVTQEAFDRLQEELDHLRGEVRADITAKIASARDEGDLKENGGYHAAREEQGKTEARIRQLEDMMRRAEVGEKRADDGLVESGMIVTIKFKGESETESFLLGSRPRFGHRSHRLFTRIPPRRCDSRQSQGKQGVIQSAQRKDHFARNHRSQAFLTQTAAS